MGRSPGPLLAAPFKKKKALDYALRSEGGEEEARGREKRHVTLSHGTRQLLQALNSLAAPTGRPWSTVVPRGEPASCSN